MVKMSATLKSIFDVTNTRDKSLQDRGEGERERENHTYVCKAVETK